MDWYQIKNASGSSCCQRREIFFLTRYHSGFVDFIHTLIRYGFLLESYILPAVTVGLRLRLLSIRFRTAALRSVPIPSSTASHRPAAL